MAADASRLYARNVQALLQHLAPGGELTLDFSDEITGGACVTRPAGATAGSGVGLPEPPKSAGAGFAGTEAEDERT
jgi:hypothetical protein